MIIDNTVIPIIIAAIPPAGKAMISVGNYEGDCSNELYPYNI